MAMIANTTSNSMCVNLRLQYRERRWNRYDRDYHMQLDERKTFACNSQIAEMAMIAITTSNRLSVNARLRDPSVCILSEHTNALSVV
jgi:hypothetical protein